MSVMRCATGYKVVIVTLDIQGTGVATSLPVVTGAVKEKSRSWGWEGRKDIMHVYESAQTERL